MSDRGLTRDHSPARKFHIAGLAVPGRYQRLRDPALLGNGDMQLGRPLWKPMLCPGPLLEPRQFLIEGFDEAFPVNRRQSRPVTPNLVVKTECSLPAIDFARGGDRTTFNVGAIR